MTDRNSGLTKVGFRATEKTVRIGNIYELHRRIEERDIVGETRIRRVFSLADAGRYALRFLLWLVGLPLPALQAIWHRLMALMTQ